MFGKSVKYTKESLDQAINELKSFGGDMGGTNLLSPLQDLLPKPKINNDFPRNVFILTDGEIDDPKGTCQYISQFSHHTRVHTFGFGSGVDRYLVKELAKQGKGTYAILEDTSSLNVNTNVIRALRLATAPAFTNLQTLWSCRPSLEVPRAPLVETFFANELFILTALLDKKDLLESSQLTIDLFETLSGKRSSTSVGLWQPEIGLREELFAICAKREIDHLASQEKQGQSLKTEIVQVSKSF